MRQILFAALCFVLGCSPPTPRTIVSKRSPDGKYLAELVESISGGIGNGDRHIEVRVSNLNSSNALAETIYKSPDVGAPSERLLWSKDSRYFLVIGRNGGLAVGPEALTDTGEVLYLLYDLEKRELKCNETQLGIPTKGVACKDVSDINFGEQFRPSGAK